MLISSLISFPDARAQTTTLAETINNVLTNINVNDLSPEWGAVYSQIFGLANSTIYDTLIQKAIDEQDWQDAIWIGVLANLNGYSSQTLNSSLKTALENIPMCGALPVTYYSSAGNTFYNTTTHTSQLIPDSFCLYDRYMIDAYTLARQLGVSRWNITQAYLECARAYSSNPPLANTAYPTTGEMLWINPSLNFALAYTGRYYDEYAETMSLFQQFAENGISNATAYADDDWLNTQTLWNGSIYNYAETASGYECETGNFAMTVAQYQNYRGLLPYFNDVIEDLQNKLLIDGFNSTGWGVPGVLQHADYNPQLRLEETLGAIAACDMLYSNFSAQMQNNYQTMLQTAWQGLIASPLFYGDQFQFTSDNATTTAPNAYSADASLFGCMLLFLDGIIPQTGSLAITTSNLRYEDYQTCFPTDQWQFDFTNQTITIPVNEGSLGFIFGSQETSASFPTNGVYQIDFASNWNSILSVTKIANITTSVLQPATLQYLIKSPIPTASASNLQPTSSPQNVPPTSTPAPSVTSTATNPQITFNSHSCNNWSLIIDFSVMAVVSSLVIISICLLRKKREEIAKT